ncbi:MAG TPA: metal-sulfur cluster assembly factor [Egibacteraceae bacterium]|nr:metal-sulfur cluster assembly factor [Egibacteraceae bacterium]
MSRTEAVVDALRLVADPCCRERGISVVDMGLLHDIAVDGGHARVDILLTSGWCPFQVDLVDSITEAVEALPDVEQATVRIVLDEAWSTGRMSTDARRKLRFLPEPGEIGDRDRYVAAHALPLAPPAATGKAAP